MITVVSLLPFQDYIIQKISYKFYILFICFLAETGNDWRNGSKTAVINTTVLHLDKNVLAGK